MPLCLGRGPAEIDAASVTLRKISARSFREFSNQTTLRPLGSSKAEITDMKPFQSPPNLNLQNGSKVVSAEALRAVPTPRHTKTWSPISHSSLVAEAMEQLEAANFTITDQVHALSHNGGRYFGILSLSLQGEGTDKTDYSWVVGLRNSHDKKFSAGLVAGTRVFVCDNLAFNGEVRITRRHTRFARRDLSHLTARAVGKLGDRFHRIDQRIAAYRLRYLEDAQAHDLIVRALDCRAITAIQMPAVIQEWREPFHEEFRPRTAWSLFNAMTEAHKSLNPHLAMLRGQALHKLFDKFVDLC